MEREQRAPLIYDTGSDEQGGHSARAAAVSRRLQLPASRNLPRTLRHNREPVRRDDDDARDARFANFFGCAHPKREECSVCGGAAIRDFDPFIDERLYNAQLHTLHNMTFATPQEAIDCYTFFNTLWGWRRRREVMDYFMQEYPEIASAMNDIDLGFRAGADKVFRKTTGAEELIGRRFEFEQDGERVQLKPYCWFVYVPKLSTADEQHYGIHFVDAQLPSYTETITFWSAMLAPRPEFATELLATRTCEAREGAEVVSGGGGGDRPRRSLSSVDVRKDIARSMVQHKRGHGSRPMTRNKSVGQLSSTTRPKTAVGSGGGGTLRLVRKASETRANHRVVQERELERYIADPRPARAERLRKYPDLKRKFERGFPRIILISDSATLEKRPDYIVRRNKSYCNVFSLQTPAHPPPSDPDEKW